MNRSIRKTAVAAKRRLVRAGVSLQNRLSYRMQRSTLPEYDLSGKNVIFLVVDCLRYDHVSPRYKRKTTPFLSQFDQDRAVSAAPWTFSSVPSILTGRYPHNHGAVSKKFVRDQKNDPPPHTIDSDITTLPELLGSSGYETYFSTAIATAELPVRGRFQSLSVQHDAHASAMVDDFVHWWKQNDHSSRFAYIQFGDLHEPLSIPPKQPFGDIPQIEGLSTWQFKKSTDPQAEFERYRTERIRLYDTVLRYVDAELRRLYEFIDERQELDDTLLVITGDHGEEFWEHAETEREHFYNPYNEYGVGHGHALVPEVLDVPIISSDLPFGAEELSTVDLAPSIAVELGLPDDEVEQFDGVPGQGAPPERALLSEEIAYGYDQQAIIKDGFHLIDSPHEDQRVLFNRESNEVVENPDKVDELLEYSPSNKTHGQQVSIDSETKGRLADLGYID